METQICRVCLRNLPLTAYYKRTGSRSGYLTLCKDCKCKQVRENRARNIEYYRNYDIYRFPWHEMAHTNSKNNKLATKAYAKRNPEKMKAHQLAKLAARNGLLVPPDRCSDCGSQSPLRKHHSDYTKPLEVEWLCRICHKKRHRKTLPDPAFLPKTKKARKGS